MTTNVNTRQSQRRASETREAARKSLKPHYWLAVLACLVAVLLGTTVAAQPSANFDEYTSEDITDDEATTFLNEIIGNPERWEQFKQGVQSEIASIPWVLVLGIGTFSVLLAFAYSWVGYCVRLGLCRFHLTLTDGEQPAISALFQYFGQAFWKSVGMNLLQKLILFLYQIPALLTFFMAFGVLIQRVKEIWSLSVLDESALEQFLIALGLFALLMLISSLLILLTLPISLRYVMASYVLAENPQMGARDALRESGRMMKGNRWRYFCLQLSFTGWVLLASITGIGAIFLAPYMEQAYTEFYHEVSGRAAIREAVEELSVITEGL